MTSWDTVFNAMKATRLENDDLLSQIVCLADRDDSFAIPITLLLNDGSMIQGDLASDLAGASTFDEPLRRQLEQAQKRTDLTVEQSVELADAMPSLAGRGLAPWLQKLQDQLLEAGARAWNEGEPLSWSELAEDDVAILATFMSRSALSLRNAVIERKDAKRPLRVTLIRVQFNSVAAWWVGQSE